MHYEQRCLKAHMYLFAPIRALVDLSDAVKNWTGRKVIDFFAR